ncbi:MAG: hypothetical protein ACUVSX_10895 [Aggregatilineales bacterium]
MAGVGTARAQDSITVFVSTETDDLRPLIEQVQSNLRAARVNIEIVTRPADANLSVYPGAFLIELRRTSFELSQSALLEETTGVVHYIPPNEGRQTADLLAGIVLYAAGRCSEAQPFFNAALRDRPLTGSAERFIAFMRGVCALKDADDYAGAAEQFTAALNVERASALIANTPVNLAWVYLQLGRRDDAFALLERYVEANQGVSSGGMACGARAYAQRAQFHALASNYSAAIADLDAALNRAPGNAALLTLRGQMRLAQYEWDSALADFNAALRADRAYADAWFQRGLLHYSVLQTGQELRAAALADFRCYLELAPDGPHATQASRYATLIEAELATDNGPRCLPCARLCNTKARSID